MDGNKNSIVKIIRVTDTRQYEERGDKWFPIPGSGQINTCERCGKDHEVHAAVELADGTVAIVGTGCMRAEKAEIKSRIKSLTTAAKNLARARAELAGLQAQEKVNAEAWTAVDALPVPEIETVTPGKWTPFDLIIGEVRQAAWRNDTADREQAVSTWQAREREKRGFRHVQTALIRCERQIEKLEDRIAG